ncbi:MAG: spoOJ protein [Deltaproteobacteria bacterium]|jgi:hypothetical protein|nr:spoOJ protein [Deltaproteobacteria bacterium]
MAERISRVKEVEVAAVRGNKTLEAGLDRRAVGRCKDAIGKHGVLHTPVIGTTVDGKRVLLSGQCEMAALRDLGVRKMDAVEVGIPVGGGQTAMLAMLLASLRTGPGALCEGMMLQEAVSAGVPRSEIQTMLGKSASWVCNRLALATRLDSGVYELVEGGLLDARSAQEVARLPAGAQFAFADMAVREGLPKSAIESLVGGYNDEGCPDAVRAQIIAAPREALKRMADKRRAVNDGRPLGMEGRLQAAKSHTAMLWRILSDAPPREAEGCMDILKDIERDLSGLLAAVRRLVSPGKMEVAHDAG